MVDAAGSVDHIQGNAHIPVTFGRAIAALDEGLEAHIETEVAQDLLELLLLAVATVDGIGHGLDNLTFAADIGPQGGVVEMAAVGLAHGVVEVLHIGEQRDRFSPWNPLVGLEC
ncbi:hypothetical protein PPS11_11626 [Pseudomonas putida S11]|nr:hypothetical protein PPS11_11626 [Pseudomonas putida S11]